MDLNKAQLIGRLTRDPEMRTTPTGTNVVSFGLATNFVWTDQSGQKQERVEFHNIVAWRKLAEICNQYLHKGSKVYVEGRLQTRSWDDQTGNKRYMTEIVTDNMIMLDTRGSNPAPAGNNAPPPPTEDPGVPTINIEEPTTAPDDVVKVEEVPF